MRSRKPWAWLLVLIACGAGGPEPPGDLVVHEWGTFLAMSGSDGAALDGLYHEEHTLPDFVHSRGRDQLRLPAVRLKGETPVIYFYTDRPQAVSVDVRFPRGIWTQWYPQAELVRPYPSATAPPDLRGGLLAWSAEVIPVAKGRPIPAVPGTSPGAPWNFARDVDAAFVRARDGARPGKPAEAERFLFYRGLGGVSLPLRMAASGSGTLALDPAGPAGVRHLFVVRVEGGRGAYAYRPTIAPGESLAGVIPPMDDARPLAEFDRALGEELAGRLVESGLFAKEARAMVNTWRASYFHTEGVRVLFVLPQPWTDEFIPLSISPRPREVVRVMVGRLELLTPDRERRAERAVRDLASADSAARLRAFDALRAQGRYVEPVLRRALATSTEDSVKALCRRLLLTDFVTDLRAAVASATAENGDEATYARARLASLLREIGRDSEAVAEGRKVLAALNEKPAPAMNRHDARHPLRARARAMEAIGDDRGAAESYGRFVRFASQAREECRGCHVESGPRDMAFFRDWWAGRKFALFTRRSGRLDSAVAGHESALADHPGDAASALSLAYLYEVQGRPDRASAMWVKLGAAPSAESMASRAAAAGPLKP